MGDVVPFPEKESGMVHVIIITAYDDFTNHIEFISGRTLTAEDAIVLHNGLNKSKQMIHEGLKNSRD